MRRYRWTAAALAALLTFSAVPAAAYAEEVPAEVQQEEKGLVEVGGDLRISGRAYTGNTLEADLSGLEPSGITEDDLWFQWFRTVDGERKNLSTDSSYTLEDSDLGSTISLWISGNPDKGYSGGLAAESYPVKATAQEALEYAAAQGDEDAIAELNEKSSDGSAEGAAQTVEETVPNEEETVFFTEEKTETFFAEEQNTGETGGEALYLSYTGSAHPRGAGKQCRIRQGTPGNGIPASDDA